MILDHHGQPISSTPPERDYVSAVVALDSRWNTYAASGLNPRRLTEILREAEEGNTERQSELFQQMEERDGKLFSLLQTRKLAVMGLEWRVVAANDSAPAKRYAEAFSEVWDNLETEDLMLDLLDALGQGHSMVAVAWERSGLWLPSRFEQVPSNQRVWDTQAKRFKVRLEGGLPEFLPFGAVLEHQFKARSGLPTRAGLLRTAAWWYLFKNTTVKDWLIYAELFGQPYRLGKYDPGTGKDDRAALERAVRGLGTDAAGVISKDTEIELLEVSRTGNAKDVYNALMERSDQEMALTVLGQTLTSGEGKHGTQALGSVHNDVRLDLVRADTKSLGRSLRQLPKAFVAFNFGVDAVADAPKIQGIVTEETDLKLEAETLEIAQQMGAPIPLDWFLEKFGIPAAGQGKLLTRPQSAPRLPLEATPRRAVALENLAQMPQGVLDGQNFISELIGASERPAAAANRDNLDDLLEAIRQAESYDDLRRRLLELYPEMDSRAISGLVQAGMTLAELAGQYAQRES
jgi:phage gp29-like protein